MIGNIDSGYPNKVDPWIFFKDTTNLNEYDYEQYRVIANSQRYDKATRYAYGADIDIYDANLMNLIQNRIYALQTYLQPRSKEHHLSYESVDPGITLIDPIEELVTDTNEEITTEDGQVLITDAQTRYSYHYGDIKNNAIWVSSYEGEDESWIPA